MSSFTIKDLEKLSGVKAHTLRIWEQRYGFIKPERTDTNIRHYSANELKTILNVALLNKYGFKISHINKMSEQEMRNKILELNQQEAQLERVVNDLVQLMVDIKNKYNTASLIISHDMNCVKLAGDKVAVLIEGKCYAFGTYDTLSKTTDAQLKRYFE